MTKHFYDVAAVINRGTLQTLDLETLQTFRLYRLFAFNPPSLSNTIFYTTMQYTFKSNAFQTASEVGAAIAGLRSQGKTVVTTNGCFDIIHAGHVTYLSDAAALGDVLIVGINCDLVVRRLKGSSRPLQSEQDRLAIIASLRMVNYAFIFREDDPRAFLEIIRPDIHVKGGDYSENILEKPVVEKHGGKIKIVPFLSDHSTTSLVEKIRKNN
jgi:rfaE bifunctional protein nucleotidyltransferase chain/domain